MVASLVQDQGMGALEAVTSSGEGLLFCCRLAVLSLVLLFLRFLFPTGQLTRSLGQRPSGRPLSFRLPFRS